jgi:hypothetical protein
MHLAELSRSGATRVVETVLARATDDLKVLGAVTAKTEEALRKCVSAYRDRITTPQIRMAPFSCQVDTDRWLSIRYDLGRKSIRFLIGPKE